MTPTLSFEAFQVSCRLLCVGEPAFSEPGVLGAWVSAGGGATAEVWNVAIGPVV